MPGSFDLQTFLDSTSVGSRIASYAANAVIYTQGDLAAEVLYIQDGAVKLAVVSKRGKEAVVGILATGIRPRPRFPR